MGLAASQARYLDLTARKSNIEFQGQMVNQQRTELANESAGIFAEMLTIDPPVTPTQSEYKKPAYLFDGLSSSSENKYKLFEWTKIDGETYDSNNNGKYTVSIEYNDGTGTISQPNYAYVSGIADLKFHTEQADRVTSIQMVSYTEGTDSTKNDIGLSAHSASPSSRIDSDLYDEAMKNYEYEYAQYQKKMSELQARTQKIQVQDRTLELQLRQLDTEQEALQTEMESVKKVIEKSVDQIFKTFQS